MHYIKIILLAILFLSCKKEIQKSEIKPKDYTSYVKEAKAYVKKNNLNKDKFILIDLDLHSGLKRFFVYDLRTII